jgi:hypothetical protein
MNIFIGSSFVVTTNNYYTIVELHNFPPLTDTLPLIDTTRLPASDLQHRPNTLPPTPLLVSYVAYILSHSVHVLHSWLFPTGGSACSHLTTLVLSLADLSTLKMEVIRSSESSVNARPTQLHIPEDDILQFTITPH